MKRARFSTWLEDRTGWISQTKEVLRYQFPEHVYKNPLFLIGGLTVILILIQIVTGILLVTYYTPSPEGAYFSVDFIQYEVPFGWLIRGLHHWSASLLVILLIIHLAHNYLFSSYKKPRELTWVFGVLLFIVMMGFSFTGYLLPWDQTAYWATKVGTEIIGSVPLIGNGLLYLARGGASMGRLTLTRFYSLHIMVLPAILLLMIAIHLVLMRRHGLSDDIRGKQDNEKSVSFFPSQVFTETIVTLFTIIVLVLVSKFFPAPLGIEADPTDASVVPRPEWYFLFLFQLLTYFPGWLEPVATVLIPSALIGWLIFIPFIDRSPERRPWKKPVTTSIFLFVGASIVTLTILASMGPS